MRLVIDFVNIVLSFKCVIFFCWLGVILFNLFSKIVIDDKLVNLYNVNVIIVCVCVFNVLW